MRVRMRTVLLMLTLFAVVIGVCASVGVAHPSRRNARTAAPGTTPSGIAHVLLLSVDGLHQSDLSWYVANHPNSTLAHLTKRGRGLHARHDPDSV